MDNFVNDNIPQISVIMSVFNGEKYLADAIESILNQTFSDFEFIIIDDGSTDRSLKIINEFAQIDKRIQVVKNDNNIGLAASLNKGISLAKGEYITRMDADDVSLPERFEKQVVYLNTHQEIAVVASNYIRVDENNNVLRHTNRPTTPSRIFFRLFFGDVIAHPTVMMRQKIFNKGFYKYNENYKTAQDYDLWLTIINKFDIANLPDNLLYYRDHSISASNLLSEDQQKNDAEIIRIHTQNLVNFQLPVNYGYAIKDFSKIESLPDAKLICKAIVSIFQHTEKRYPNMFVDDREYIRKLCASKLIHIWTSFDKPLSLYPIYFYAIRLLFLVRLSKLSRLLNIKKPKLCLFP